MHHEWDFDGDGTYDADGGEGRARSSTSTARWGPLHREAARDRRRRGIERRRRCVLDVQRRGSAAASSGPADLTLDGCLTVKGPRRVAPNGVTVNGFTLGGTPDGAQVAIDVAQYRAATVPASQTAAILTGAAPIPDRGASVPVGTSCGAAVGTSAFALKDFKDDDQSAPFRLADGLTFASLRPSGNGSLDFTRGGAKFDFDGVFPSFLLNWAAYGHGTYAVGPDCHQEHVTLRLGTFASRFIQFPEVRLERIDTNKLGRHAGPDRQGLQDGQHERDRGRRQGPGVDLQHG